MINQHAPPSAIQPCNSFPSYQLILLEPREGRPGSNFQQQLVRLSASGPSRVHAAETIV